MKKSRASDKKVIHIVFHLSTFLKNSYPHFIHTYPQVIHTNKRLKYHVFATYPHKINYTTTIYINVDKNMFT